MLTLTLALTLGGAPMADAWPYAFKRLPDGSIEYSYEFTALRASGGSADAKEKHGAAAVAAFLKTLPKEVKVRVAGGTPLELAAGRGPDARPLAPSWGQVYDGPIESANPLARTAGARLRAPLHPDEPKLLVGAEQVAWEVQSLEESALAAVELDTDALRRELWARVASLSLARARTTEGDGREGALTLAARALAVHACLDPSRLPDVHKADGELTTAVAAEVQRLSQGPDAFVGPPPWSWSAELSCAWVRVRAMGTPFEQSRAGTAAVLTYLWLLEKDLKVKTLDARLRARRDRFEGTPVDEPLMVWRAATRGDSAAAFEGLGEFIDTLPTEQRVPPPLVALPVTPFSRFLFELSGAERQIAWDELAHAAQENRIPFQGKDWPVLREAALVPLVAEPVGGLVVDSAWRNQGRASFAAVQGGAVDGREVGADLEPPLPDRVELSVRLMVPPLLEVEPSAELFKGLAASLDALGAALQAEGLTGLKAWLPEGRRGEVLLAEVRRWSARLGALARLANGDLKDSKAIEQARSYLTGWRSEASASRDVRSVAPFFLSVGGERVVSCVVGVGRRELIVGFAEPPRVEIVGAPAGLVADVAANQRYLVPVLSTAHALAPAQRRRFERADLRAVIDAVDRDPSRVETAVSDALRQ